jgi:recombination protein U
MQAVVIQKGIAFFIVRFSKLDRTFVVPFDLIEKAWLDMEAGGRKSIPLAVFEEFAEELKLGYAPRIDYLQVVKKFVANK